MQKLFEKRPDFITVYEPLIGNSMLEFGNKREGEMVYKHTFEELGFRHVSIDLNGQDGALKRDLRDSMSDLGQFDMVTNIGTSEHVVDNQEAVWRNLVEATKVGGVLICLTPSAEENNWVNHGHWYPHEDFYLKLAELNGFKVENLFRSDCKPVQNTLCRMKKVEEKPFVMPDLSLFYYRAKAKKYGW